MTAAFVDPRSKPVKPAATPAARTTTDPGALAELHRLCRESRIYDVENWIRAGKPLQVASGIPQKGRTTSALGIALEARNHSLTLLLLCNGYDPNLERDCPLDTVLSSRSWELLDLLMEWGADPLRVSVGDLFDTYNTSLPQAWRQSYCER
jgi:hypothetical protein